MALRETQRSTKFNVPRRFPDARPISVLHQVQSILPVLNVYWTEVAEFCAAMRNQRESHAIRTKLAKNRKKRDPKKNEEKIYTKRKRSVSEKKLANSTRSFTHARDATYVVPPGGRRAPSNSCRLQTLSHLATITIGTRGNQLPVQNTNMHNRLHRVTRYTYGITRNSALHQVQCVAPLPECATNFGASPSSKQFTRSERVLDGSRRILRSNAQSTLLARN